MIKEGGEVKEGRGIRTVERGIKGEKERKETEEREEGKEENEGNKPENDVRKWKVK